MKVASVIAVVTSLDIWYDIATLSGKLHVALQAYDINGNVQVASGTILYTKAHVTNNISISTFSTCTADTNTGICNAILTFPIAFYTTSAVESVTISIGISVALLEALPNIVVYLHPKPQAYIVLNDVVVELPQQTLFPGKSFNVDVQGSTTVSIGAYSIDCTVNVTQLAIMGASASSAWSLTKNIQGGLLKVTASPTDVLKIPNGIVASETLFTMNLQVLATVNENTEALITCSIITLADKNGVNV